MLETIPLMCNNLGSKIIWKPAAASKSESINASPYRLTKSAISTILCFGQSEVE